MLCPLCGKRKARRACPALGRRICPVCCGTKRQVEIRCPADCGYLSLAREHPPAAVQRQREHDLALLVPIVHDLTRQPSQMFFVLQTVIARYQPDGLYSLTDDDVAEAAATLAATLETEQRGVIYQHRAATLPAEHLARALEATLGKVRADPGRSFDRDAAAALRRIEQAARTTRTREPGGGPTAYLALARRFADRLPDPEIGGEPVAGPAGAAGERPGLIIP
ncbi:MAG: hypothetical protein KGN76_03990 [Acidobacteriota bacterium]|nr:hypothetical protein [Acidobacteriota bacterium]